MLAYAFHRGGPENTSNPGFSARMTTPLGVSRFFWLSTTGWEAKTAKRKTDRHSVNCTCENCKRMRSEVKYTHPYERVELVAKLLERIHPEWNPTVEKDDPQPNRDGEIEGTDQPEVVYDPANDTQELKEAITIFGDDPTEQADHTTASPRNETAPVTTVYTDGACTNNGREDASAGSGVWYGDDDPRGLGIRVGYQDQSNQTGELIAALLAIKNYPPDEDLIIISDSKYMIDGLT